MEVRDVAVCLTGRSGPNDRNCCERSPSALARLGVMRLTVVKPVCPVPDARVVDVKRGEHSDES